MQQIDRMFISMTLFNNFIICFQFSFFVIMIYFRRSCWVCFGTDEDDRDAAWVRPCRCRGTTRWVHQNCLQRWIDEKQKGNSTTKVTCPQCNTEYIIIFPKLGEDYGEIPEFAQVLEILDCHCISWKCVKCLHSWMPLNMSKFEILKNHLLEEFGNRNIYNCPKFVSV